MIKTRAQTSNSGLGHLLSRNDRVKIKSKKTHRGLELVDDVQQLLSVAEVAVHPLKHLRRSLAVVVRRPAHSVFLAYVQEERGGVIVNESLQRRHLLG